MSKLLPFPADPNASDAERRAFYLREVKSLQADIARQEELLAKLQAPPKGSLDAIRFVTRGIAWDKRDLATAKQRLQRGY